MRTDRREVSVPMSILGMLVFLSLLLRSRRGQKRRLDNLSQPATQRTVWIVNQYAVAPDSAGSTRHHEFASIVEYLGWHTIIFASPFSLKERQYFRPVSPRNFVRKRTEDGVAFVWLYSIPYQHNNWRRYLNMLSFAIASVMVGIIHPRPDVIVGSSPQLFTGLAAWLLARWHRVPFVFEVRDLWPDSLIDMGLANPLVIGPLARIERHLYKHADHIIPLSEGISQAIHSKGIQSGKITLIPNAASSVTSSSADVRTDSRTRYGWGDRIVFVYIGAHGPANSLDTVVETARLLSANQQVLFVLVGDGPDKSRLVQQSLGLSNVEFFDAVQKKDVHELLAASDVGLITLRKSKVFEGVRPNKFFDYIAAGLPIITNVPGETKMLVEEANAGIFVIPEDPMKLSEAVHTLASDAELRARLGKGAKAYGELMPSREDTAKTFVGVLAPLAERRSTTGLQSESLPKLERLDFKDNT